MNQISKNGKVKVVIKILTVLMCSMLLLSGCIRTKYIQGERIVTKDSVVLKDTTIYVAVPPQIIPGDTVKLTDTVPCPDVEWKKEIKKGSTKLTASISKGKIDIECKTDSLVKLIDSLKVRLQLKEQFSTTVIEKPPVIKVEYRIPWWIWVVLTLCAVMIAALIWRK